MISTMVELSAVDNAETDKTRFVRILLHPDHIVRVDALKASACRVDRAMVWDSNDCCHNVIEDIDQIERMIEKAHLTRARFYQTPDYRE